jgi:serine/threonine protein kinase
VTDEIDDDLLAAAAKVGAVDTADWETAASARPDLRETLARLELLDRLATAHRTARAEPDEMPDADPVTRAERTPPVFTWGILRALDRIGEGSFGEVWRAYDPSLHREVALKLRLTDPARASSLAASATVGTGMRRSLDEARRLASVRHPNVLTVYGAAEHEGRVGMWTELIRGETLEARLARTGPLSPRETAAIGADLCAALAEVHRAGLVHGDVKPTNVMLETRGEGPPRVVLMDFGAAHESRWQPTPKLGAPAGTPLVMAPEVLAGGDATTAADLYSVGVILFHLLTGRYPVEAATLDELRRRVARGERQSLDALRPAPPRALRRAVEHALAGEPAARPRDAAALRQELLATITPHGTRRVALLAGGVSLAALLATGLWVWRTFGGDPLMHSTPVPEGSDPGLFVPTSWTLAGPAQHWNATKRIESAGDVNGDGYDDLLVSDIDYTSHLDSQGEVRLYMGSAQGLSETPAWRDTGHFEGGLFGHNFASAGDVNHDGYADVLVQERGYRDGKRVCSAVSLYLGSPHGLEMRPAWVHLGPGDGTYFGDGLAGIGDVNGDGYDDVAIGETLAKHQFEEEGAVYVFLGGPHGLATEPQIVLYGGSTKAQLGWSVRRVGDVDRDGYADLLVGVAYWTGKERECGAARLYRGGPHGISATPMWSTEGDEEREWLGQEASGIGDVDGDGYPDFIVGGHGWSSWGMINRGVIELWRGGPRGPRHDPDARFEGRSSASGLGGFARWAGDFDGDGYADLVLTSPMYSPSPDRRRAGLIEILRGGPHGIRRAPAWVRVGTHGDDLLGYSMAFPDVNGDGRPDLVIGEPGQVDSLGAGRIRLYLARGGPAPARASRGAHATRVAPRGPVAAEHATAATPGH